MAAPTDAAQASAHAASPGTGAVHACNVAILVFDEVVRDARFVRYGKVWSPGGICAGIDMSLAMVRTLLGCDTAVAAEMEWLWHQT